MGELLRLYQVSVQSEKEAPLCGCSLEMAEKEVLFVVGDRRSGKHLLMSLLGGQRRIDSGRLYLRENRLSSGKFGKAGILTVDNRSRMTGALPVCSNIRSLGGKISSMDSFRELLLEMGIESSPWKLTEECSSLEQVLLWFALAVLRRDALICLELSELSLSEEDFRRLSQAVEACRKRGISVMILDKTANPLMKSADRVAWMREGKIIKNFYRREDFPWFPAPGSDQCICRRISTREGEQRAVVSLNRIDRREEQMTLREGDMLILCDPDWPLEETLTDYLRDLKPVTENGTEEGKDAGEFRGEGGTVYIPEDSQDYLMENARIGRNLMLTASRFVGTRFGFVQRDMENFLEMQFRRRFGIEPSVELAAELTLQEKKYLTLFRASLSRPRLILLENPLFAFSAEDRRDAAAFLRETAAGGSAMIISLKTPEEAELFSDRNFP